MAWNGVYSLPVDSAALRNTPTQIILFVHHANGLRIEIKKLEWRLKPMAPHDLDDQPTRVNLDGCGVLLLRGFLAAHVRSDPMGHGPFKKGLATLRPTAFMALPHPFRRQLPDAPLSPPATKTTLSCIILTHLCNQQRIKSIGPFHRLA